MQSDSMKRATLKYQREKTKQYGFKLVLSSDADIIEWLDNQPNKQAAIKQLIRAEIARTGTDRQ